MVARKQKTSTPVYVPMHACLYLCKVLIDIIVLPQGKTQLTLTETDKLPCFLCKWQVTVAPSLHLVKASLLQMCARFHHNRSMRLCTTALKKTVSCTAESKEV